MNLALLETTPLTLQGCCRVRRWRTAPSRGCLSLHAESEPPLPRLQSPVRTSSKEMPRPGPCRTGRMCRGGKKRTPGRTEES